MQGNLGASDTHAESSEIDTKSTSIPKSNASPALVMSLSSPEWPRMVLSRTERKKPGASKRLIHCSLCCIPTATSGVLIGKEEIPYRCSPAANAPANSFLVAATTTNGSKMPTHALSGSIQPVDIGPLYMGVW